MLMTTVGEGFGHFGQQHPHFATNITVMDSSELPQWSIMRSFSVMNRLFYPVFEFKNPKSSFKPSRCNILYIICNILGYFETY